MKHVQLVQLPIEAIHALAQGDLKAANRWVQVPLTAFFIDDGESRVWQRRSRQLQHRPQDAAWITRAVVDTEIGATVARAGFHSAPNTRGMLEVGYAVDPAYRRRGYARAAMRELLAWAEAESRVHILRACARPDNEPSINLILQCGFVAVGEQWDPEDGEETVFERSADPE